MKNRLSEYIRLAASGETILVTDRGRVVAELIPPREGRARTADDAELAERVCQGIVTPPAMVQARPPPRRPVLPTTRVLADLAADREDR